ERITSHFELTCLNRQPGAEWHPNDASHALTMRSGEGAGSLPCEGAVFLFANGSPAFRKRLMKSFAARHKARFFDAIKRVAPPAGASCTGRALSSDSVAPKWSADS